LIQKNYLVPENMSLLKPPKLNIEFESVIQADSKKKDDSLAGIQKQLATGISALAKGLSLIVNTSSKEVCQSISDSGRILCDLQRKLSEKRRSSLLPCLKTNMRKTAESGIIDEQLFGSDLATRIKTAKDLEKSAIELQDKRNNRPKQSNRATRTNTKSNLKGDLNFKRPSRRTQQPKDGQWKLNYRRH